MFFLYFRYRFNLPPPVVKMTFSPPEHPRISLFYPSHFCEKKSYSMTRKKRNNANFNFRDFVFQNIQGGNGRCCAVLKKLTI